MTPTKKAPQGRAYALLLPENLRGDKSHLLVTNGIIWVLEASTGVLCPLEAVCDKIQIPGVAYPTEDPR